jgi:hypothetical protein
MVKIYTVFTDLKKSTNQKLPVAVPSTDRRIFFSKATKLRSEANPASYSVSTRGSLPGVKLRANAFRKYFLPLISILCFVSLFYKHR